MPDFFDSPKKWIKFSDTDGDKKLDKKEVLGIILAVSVFDECMVMELINDIFIMFDKDNSGKISLSEFASAEGLFELLRANSGQL
jgi:Ca2+-binding EF-hand superfamily protein